MPIDVIITLTDKIIEYLFIDQRVTLVVAIFVIAIGLSFWGARRMESD
jgi:hypothetical protein